jgi:hypothetical protein
LLSREAAGYNHPMNKDLIKGVVILLTVVVALGIFLTLATDDGVQKLGCVFRALAHGVALTNIHSLCSL